MSDTIAISWGMDTPQNKSRLLLIDGDPKSLRVLDVSLKKAGFDVTTATSLDTELPDLIISDTDLADMDGFELCGQVKARPDWAKIPFLFVSSRKSIEDKIHGLELGVDDYLTKPIYIKEIGIRVRTALQRAERERLESRREGRTRFAGALSDVGVVDLVQTIELNRKSGIIHIVSRDDHRGSIFFRDGKVIDAEVGRLSGAHALYRLFSWSDGQFAVEFKHIRRHDVVDMSVAALLMEGMRRLDEAAHLLESLPPLSHVLEVDCRVLAEELAELPDEVNSVLRLCDGARAFQEVLEDSDLPDLETLEIVSKLFLGQIIFAREPPRQSGESEAGTRLAHWLAEGGADANPIVIEDASGGPRPNDKPQAVSSPLSSQPPASLPPATMFSAEDTLGAALPSGVEVGKEPPELTDSAAETLKGIPLDSVLADHPSEPETAPSDASPPQPVSSASPSPEGQRSTKPMGLAERLLSEDSAVKTTAMHEALSDDDGRVREPQSPDRNTQSYGNPPSPTAALVQDVVTHAHVSTPQAPPPAEPERPKKEVDWGAWPAVADPGPHLSSPVTHVSKPPSSAPDDAPPSFPTSKTSASELDASDLEPLAPAPDSLALASAQQAAPSSPPQDAPAVDDQAEPLDAADMLPNEPEGPAAPDREAVHSPTSRGPASSEGSGTPSRASGAAKTKPSDASASAPAFPAAHDSAETTQIHPTLHRGWRPWLLVLAAFGLGMLLYLVFRQAIPSREQQLASSAAPAPAQAGPVPPSPEAGVSATPPVATEPSAAAAGVPSAPGKPEAKAATRFGLGAPPKLAAESEARQNCLETNAGGKGRARAVAAACRPALEENPDDAEVMVILARAEIERGRLVTARSLARKALAVDPQRFEAYVYLGTAEQAAGRIDEARAAYKKYLELDPEGQFARELRAILGNM
jgi:CheY-like chemotaxis protein